MDSRWNRVVGDKGGASRRKKGRKGVKVSAEVAREGVVGLAVR